MTFENDLLKVEQDGDSVDIDFLRQPGDGNSVWLGIHGVDISIRRVPGEDGDPATLVVSVWEPGIVSNPLAEMNVLLEGKD